MSKIVDRMIKLRAQAGWNQSDLADKMGINAATVHQIEGRNGYLSVPNLILLAKAFNMTLDEFLETPKDDFIKQSTKSSFYAKFQDFRKLNEEDQAYIISLCKRLLKKG